MKVYRVARSIFGELGSLKRRETLAEDDPRIAANPTAVNALVKRKLLILDDAAEGDDTSPKPAKGKRRPAQPDPNTGPEGA